MPDGPIYLTTDSARRVANAVRIVERMPVATGQKGPPPSIVAPSRFAVTSSPIAAADGSMLGKGTAALHLITVGGDGVATHAAIPAAHGLADVTVYHAGPVPIASGRLVQLKVIDGVFVVDVDYC